MFSRPDVKGIQRGVISESDPDFEAKVDPKHRAAIEASRKKHKDPEPLAKEAGLKTEIRARYKIELTFGLDRTIAGPNQFGIRIWESGKMFHGGGDCLMFWCKDNRQGEDGGCWSPIPASNINDAGIAYCPNCKRASNSELLTDVRFFRLTTMKAVEVVEKMFRQLNSNADIYLKYHPTDIRYQSMLKDKGLEEARRLKGLHLYPLKNILVDTAAGAPLSGRIKAFLSS